MSIISLFRSQKEWSVIVKDGGQSTIGTSVENLLTQIGDEGRGAIINQLLMHYGDEVQSQTNVIAKTAKR